MPAPIWRRRRDLNFTWLLLPNIFCFYPVLFPALGRNSSSVSGRSVRCCFLLFRGRKGKHKGKTRENFFPFSYIYFTTISAIFQVLCHFLHFKSAPLTRHTVPLGNAYAAALNQLLRHHLAGHRAGAGALHIQNLLQSLLSHLSESRHITESVPCLLPFYILLM